MDTLASAKNAHLAVRESEGEVAFLHRLVPGSTDRSYGLHVARLAGLPPPLLQEADRLLQRLEATGLTVRPTGRRTGATRYTQAVLLPEAPTPVAPVEEALRALDLDRMSPLEALHWIAEWRRRLDRGEGAPPAP